MAIDEIDGMASLATAFKIAPMFGMAEKDTRAIAAEIGSAVAGWRDAAARFGITSDKIERMASAFDHEDLKAVT